MPTIPAFLPLVLRWRPVGEHASQPVTNAYCLLEIADDAAVARLEQKVSEASIITLGTRPRRHILARTDTRGVIMTVPHPGVGAPDPLSLSALAPLLFPVMTALKIWWTHDRQIFDEVLELERAGGPSGPLARSNAVLRAFDEKTPLPEAIDRTLIELENGAELRARLLRSRENTSPTELLRLADDGRTWCVELCDRALQVAVDTASDIQELVAKGAASHAERAIDNVEWSNYRAAELMRSLRL